MRWLTGKCWSMGSMMKGFKMKNVEDSSNNFYVEFMGPRHSKLEFHCFSCFLLGLLETWILLVIIGNTPRQGK